MGRGRLKGAGAVVETHGCLLTFSPSSVWVFRRVLPQSKQAEVTIDSFINMPPPRKTVHFCSRQIFFFFRREELRHAKVRYDIVVPISADSPSSGC